MSLILINAQTTGATSFPFKVVRGEVPALVASGLATTETVTLQVSVNGTFRNSKDSSGADITLTATSPDRRVEAEGTYRVVSTNTVSPLTVQKG